nr:transposase [Azospirillum oryzae]
MGLASALGYPGRAKVVHLWLQQHRSVPAKTTPHRWRKETPTRSGGPPALPSPKRLAWALVKPAAARNDEQAAAVAQAEQDAETHTVVGLARRFTALVRAAGRTAESDQAAAGLEAWLAEASSCGITAIQTFAAGLEQDGAAVRAALTLPWSSGQAEGQINRLKLLKRQMYGRASLDLLRSRTLLVA